MFFYLIYFWVPLQWRICAKSLGLVKQSVILHSCLMDPMALSWHKMAQGLVSGLPCAWWWVNLCSCCNKHCSNRREQRSTFVYLWARIKTTVCVSGSEKSCRYPHREECESCRYPHRCDSWLTVARSPHYGGCLTLASTQTPSALRSTCRLVNFQIQDTKKVRKKWRWRKPSCGIEKTDRRAHNGRSNPIWYGLLMDSLIFPQILIVQALLRCLQKTDAGNSEMAAWSC